MIDPLADSDTAAEIPAQEQLDDEPITVDWPANINGTL